MKSHCWRLKAQVLAFVWLPFFAAANARAQSEMVSQLPEIVVTGDREEAESLPAGAPLNAVPAVSTPAEKARAADTGALLQQVPGAAVVRNGPQTGIVQLRGLSGDRVKVSLDGRTVTPACPNHMDPPLHYAAPAAVESMVVMAGATPVSMGGDSIAGTVLLRSSRLPFATGGKPLVWFGDMGSVYRSSNDGYGFDGKAGAASENLSVAYQGSWQTADDLRFKSGRVRDTGYDTQQHTLRASLLSAIGVWGFETGILRTRDAGTPALTMDMIEDDGYRIGLDVEADFRFGSLSSRAYYHSIDHLMDNYSQRPLPSGMMRMFSEATSDDVGWSLDATLPRGRHTFRLGTDVHFNKLDTYQENAMTGLTQDTFNDAQRTRVGAYGEWQADWSPRWMTQLGVRNDTVISDAGDIDHWFPMGPAAADAAAFNARSHDFVDANFDVTVTTRFTPNTRSAYEFAFARKNRTPSILERYLWTPLSASAGQADGRTYIGNLDLDPETSHQLSVSAEWFGERWRVKTTPFYNFVSDYIQGVPLASSEDVILQFQNLDRADLYGVDTHGQYDLPRDFSLSTTLSYVRGRDRDRHDNLYRIAPLHGTVSLRHRLGNWESELALEWADSQNEVADYNDERPTSGYALVHLRSGYAFQNHWKLHVGLENIFDEKYAEHVGGINRVLGSDVAVGEHLPGAGRYVYVSLRYEL